jgi:hypothetical protein
MNRRVVDGFTVLPLSPPGRRPLFGGGYFDFSSMSDFSAAPIVGFRCSKNLNN